MHSWIRRSGPSETWDATKSSARSFWNVDFAVSKNTQIFERLNLQLRAEFFNIFNHPNFALPNFFVVPGLGPAGLITQTPDQAQTNPGLGGGGPRVIQVAAKFTF